MVREVVAGVEIDAEPDEVWTVLTDFEGYATWNPFLYRIDGAAALGASLRAKARLPGGGNLRFRAHIFRCGQGELCWEGGLWVPGMFAGRHCFSITPIAGGRVRFTQREVFRGALLPLVWPLIGVKIRRGFVLMNAALKGHLESSRSP